MKNQNQIEANEKIITKQKQKSETKRNILKLEAITVYKKKNLGKFRSK